MKRSAMRSVVVAALTVTLWTSHVSRATADRQEHYGGAVIVEWNQLAQENIAGPPFSQVRSYAMVHVAMADAVVAIDGRYEPFHVWTKAPRGASAVAAAAQAAHDVLVALIPTSQPALDAALRKRLAAIPPGPRELGAQVGGKVAQRVLAWRANDGFAEANPQPPAFLDSELPGIWRPTASGPAQFSRWGSAEPFGLLTPTQFLPVAHPQLESAEYASGFNEVKEKGRASGSTRTEAETRFAQLFAGVGEHANVTNPFRLWHNVASEVAQRHAFSLAQTARLFALLTTSIHDGLQTAHASKFVYRLWRPETAIDQAGVDGNADTVPEPGWVPLLSTPPYPSHASNMSCIGASAAEALKNVFRRDSIPFTATWYSASTPPAVVHAERYQSFWQLARDEGDSRVAGGIHFRFELDAAYEVCEQVADYIFEHYMQPRIHGYGH